MRITGAGAITYTDFSSQYGNEIKSVVIGNGIYYLNGFCFDSLPNLESVELADSVKTIQFDVNIPKTEHDYEWLAGTELNCIKTGTDVYQKCKKCGAIKNPPAILPKTGHDYGGWEIFKKATCTEDGEETSICNGCGRVRKRVIKKTGHKWGVWSTTSKATVLIPRLSR